MEPGEGSARPREPESGSGPGSAVGPGEDSTQPLGETWPPTEPGPGSPPPPPPHAYGPGWIAGPTGVPIPDPDYRPAPQPTVAWAPPPTSPPPLVVAGMVPSNTLPRLVAYMLDGLLIALLYVIPAIIIGIATGAFRDVDFSSEAGGRLFSQRLAGPAAVVGTIVSFIYFVPFWASGGQGTPGMRFLRIRVANAADGARLTMNQAIRRWVGFGGPLGLLGILPGIGAQASSLASLWSLVLFISVVASPVKQGIHDTFAKTVVLMPATGPGGRLVAGCLLLVFVIAVPFVLLFVIGVYAAMLMGGPYYPS